MTINEQHSAPIHALLKNRWSPRTFAAHTPSAADLLSLMEAARWAPSANNLQPWAFVSALQGEQGFDELAGSLSEFNAAWAPASAALILAVARVEREPGRPNHYALYDLGQAVAHLSLQAVELGLQVHQMGGFDREKVARSVHLPEGWQAVTMLAVGRPLEVSPARVRERKPLAEFAFSQSWGQPLGEALPAVHGDD